MARLGWAALCSAAVLVLLDVLPGAAAVKLVSWGARAVGAVGAAALIGSAPHPLMLAATAADPPLVVYKSGKNPVLVDPGNPKVGSKKDSSFLRALSSCKQDCQKPGEGMAKLDCLQDCQDQCCTTYEQCTFKVKKGEGEL